MTYLTIIAWIVLLVLIGVTRHKGPREFFVPKAKLDPTQVTDLRSQVPVRPRSDFPTPPAPIATRNRARTLCRQAERERAANSYDVTFLSVDEYKERVDFAADVLLDLEMLSWGMMPS